MDKKLQQTKGKVFTGVVVSTKMNKTVIVSVTTVTRHPLYNKGVKHTVRHAAHVEGIDVSVGDTVHIKETKPISKTKHFIVLGKITK